MTGSNGNNFQMDYQVTVLPWLIKKAPITTQILINKSLQVLNQCLVMAFKCYNDAFCCILICVSMSRLLKARKAPLKKKQKTRINGSPSRWALKQI